MSKYTFNLRRLCEMAGRETVESWFMDYNLEDYLTYDQIDVITNNSVWSKDRLARMIVDHYLMREVGVETPGLFKHYAKTMMQEIMEEKLPKIYSMALKYNPLDSNDYEETFTSRSNGSTNSTATTSGSGLSVASDTPQGQISKEAILGGSYASSTDATETDSTANDVSSTNSDQNYTRSIKGRSGSNTPAKLIAEYRKNVLAINREIINELDVLFMGIF